MLRRLCRIAVLGAALAAASVSHAQLIIPGGSSSGSGATPGGSSGQLQFNNAGAFGGGAGTAWDDTNRALTISGATVTSSKPLLDLSQTWNAGAVAFSALKLNVTDTASASGSLLLDLQVGGVSKVSVTKLGALSATGLTSTGNGRFGGDRAAIGYSHDGFSTVSGGMYSFVSSAGSATVAPDSAISRIGAAFLAIGNGTAGDFSGSLKLYSIEAGGNVSTPNYLIGRASANKLYLDGAAGLFKFINGTTGTNLFQLAADAADTLALRNGASVQTLNLYGTYTDASNYERLAFTYGSNQFKISTESAGTGVSRYLTLKADANIILNGGNAGSRSIQFQVGGVGIWYMTGAGHFVAETDNTLDIGASGANRARNAYLAGKIVTGSTTLHETSVALTNGAAAATGTLTNAPAAGNPTKWIPINDNGTTRYIPAW